MCCFRLFLFDVPAENRARVMCGKTTRQVADREFTHYFY